MPATGTMPTVATTEMLAMQPMVAINGAVFDYTTCLSIEQSAGITPAKAFIRISGNAYDINGNLTLNAYNFGIGFGARVAIFDSSDTLFLGCIIKRRDQGEANSVIYECWDDRWLLSKIPVRGCLVWDPVDTAVKFIDRYSNRVNPEGARNCICQTVSGMTGPTPVFSAYAEQSAGFRDQDTDDNWSSNQVSSWTPAKYLKYLCAIVNLAPASIAGLNKDTWRHIVNSKRIKWDPATVDFGSASEMNQRMPDRTFQGQTVLAALDETLKICGEYGLKVVYNGDTLKTEINFFKRAKDEEKKENQSITLLRGGDAADIRTAFDFELEEDISEVCETALVQGSSVKVESEFRTASEATLAKGWTADEQTTFLACVKGTGTSPNNFAQVPSRTPKAGETWAGMSKITLNTGNWPSKGVRGETADAVKAVRQILSRSFRCYQVDSDKAYIAGILKGITSGNVAKYANTTQYPYLKLPRPVLPEQLQYFVDLSNNALRERLDLRVRVYRDTTYYDTTHNSGLRIGSNGSIWLDGLCETDTPSSDRTYDNSLTKQTATPRHVSINCAVPLDVRVSKVYDAASGDLDGGLTNDLGGGLMMYIDCPEAFKEEVQFNSHPGPYTGTLLNDGSTPVSDSASTGAGGLTRQLVSDDENGRMLAHARRRLNPRRLVRRTSSWKLIGIRPEYIVGMWIDTIDCRGQAGDQSYKVGAPVETITFDFIQQVTTIGGLVAFTERNQNSAAAFGKPVAMLAEPAKEEGGKVTMVAGAPAEGGRITLHEGRPGAPRILGATAPGRPVEMPTPARYSTGLNYPGTPTGRVGLNYPGTPLGGGPRIGVSGAGITGGAEPMSEAATSVRQAAPQKPAQPWATPFSPWARAAYPTPRAGAQAAPMAAAPPRPAAPAANPVPENIPPAPRRTAPRPLYPGEEE